MAALTGALRASLPKMPKMSMTLPAAVKPIKPLKVKVSVGGAGRMPRNQMAAIQEKNRGKL